MTTDLEARLRAALSYDPETGEFRWRVTLSPRNLAGKLAGSNHRGYRRICIDGRAYRAHRLAWFLTHGEWPPANLDLDHINGDKSDNRIANLRLATHSQNVANTGAKRNGLKGAYPTQSGTRWSARLWHHGKAKRLGMYDTEEEAHAAYCAAAQEAFGEFFNDGARRARAGSSPPPSGGEPGQ